MPVSVRYIVDDVDAAIAFYTAKLGFKMDLIPRLGSPGSRAANCICC